MLGIENAKCSICLNLWHDVVTVAPCLHNFCNGCFSEWLRRSSANSRDKSQSAACPQCRTAVQSVGRNHFLHNIEEAILQAFSSLQRSDEEIALLESYAPVKTNILIKAIYTIRCTTRQRSVPSSASTLPWARGWKLHLSWIWIIILFWRYPWLINALPCFR